ncbi:FecR domain-containing protein [Qipengyuania sp. YG27]|uniref:FecR domain-containing protein n=1 Tax=Qipengyuania mesophila TaxID=2867246 RepID=A0ABS7JWX7_9SPHN|nr:FecR domain-containing protein [Qipengyuania mesophila]MBX7502162.1 FecR domain-containing protein [Qipengyuania mesophila]
MSDRIPDQLRAAATAWHLKLATASEEDWLAFTDWLEADPAHNRAYEDVLAAEDEVDAALAVAAFPEPVVIDDVEEPAELPVSGAGWKWGALAASLVAAVALTFQLLPRDDRYAIETSAGETRTVALADGGEIALNGDTRIILDRGDPRFAELRSGEARFEIVHDASHPFVVTVGEDRLVDIGTVFNVALDDARLRVGVSEGSVRYEAAGAEVELRPGDVLTADGSGAKVARQSAASIGSWADGALVYEAAPLVDVAADLTRATGSSFTVSDALQARRFSGVIQTTGDAESVGTRAADVLGVSVARNRDGWIFNP